VHMIFCVTHCWTDHIAIIIMIVIVVAVMINLLHRGIGAHNKIMQLVLEKDFIDGSVMLDFSGV